MGNQNPRPVNRVQQVQQQQFRQKRNLVLLAIITAASVGYRVYLLIVDTDITSLDIFLNVVTFIFIMILYGKVRQQMMQQEQVPNQAHIGAAYRLDLDVDFRQSHNNEALSPVFADRLIHMTYEEYLSILQQKKHKLDYIPTVPMTQQQEEDMESSLGGGGNSNLPSNNSSFYDLSKAYPQSDAFPIFPEDDPGLPMTTITTTTTTAPSTTPSANAVTRLLLPLSTFLTTTTNNPTAITTTTMPIDEEVGGEVTNTSPTVTGATGMDIRHRTGSRSSMNSHCSSSAGTTHSALCCSICLENYHSTEKVMILPCHHIYHAECVRVWFQQHNNCPYCKQSIPAFFNAAANTNTNTNTATTATTLMTSMPPPIHAI